MEEALLKLGKYVSQLVTEHHNHNKIVEIQRVYIHTKLTEFNYMDGRIRSIGWENITSEKREWDRSDFRDFLHKIILSSDEYTNCVIQLSTKVENERIRIEWILGEFISRIAETTYLGNFSEEFVNGEVSDVISQITDFTPEWHITAFVCGAWANSSLDLSSMSTKIIMKKPEAKDFERILPLDYVTWFHPSFYNDSMRISCVIEIRCVGYEQNIASNEMILIQNLLCMFKLGSVYAHSYEFKPPNALELIGGRQSSNSKNVKYRYEIKRNDTNKWINFYTTMRPLMQELREDIDIALNMYKEALFESSNHSIIAFAIYALEALYLNVTQELKFRLSLCLTTLLKAVKFPSPSLEIYNNVKLAYDVRSAYGHGSKYKKKIDEAKLAETILNYVRVSILIFIQTKHIKKKEFLDILEKSLIDDDYKKNLQDVVKNIVVTF